MRQKFYLIAIFFISFVAGALYFSAKYYNFGLTIDNLLFVFANPLDGIDSAVIKMIVVDTLRYIMLPSIVVAIFITFLPKILQHKWTLKCYDFIAKFLRESFAHNIGFSLCVSICFLIVAINAVDLKISVSEYISNKFFKKVTYSTFYEENYIAPKISDFKSPKNKRNLIVIVSESMESTFSGKNVPTGGVLETYQNIPRTAS